MATDETAALRKVWLALYDLEQTHTAGHESTVTSIPAVPLVQLCCGEYRNATESAKLRYRASMEED